MRNFEPLYDMDTGHVAVRMINPDKSIPKVDSESMRGSAEIRVVSDRDPLISEDSSSESEAEPESDSSSSGSSDSSASGASWSKAKDLPPKELNHRVDSIGAQVLN